MSYLDDERKRYPDRDMEWAIHRLDQEREVFLQEYDANAEMKEMANADLRSELVRIVESCGCPDESVKEHYKSQVDRLVAGFDRRMAYAKRRLDAIDERLTKLRGF